MRINHLVKIPQGSSQWNPESQTFFGTCKFGKFVIPREELEIQSLRKEGFDFLIDEILQNAIPTIVMEHCTDYWKLSRRIAQKLIISNQFYVGRVCYGKIAYIGSGFVFVYTDNILVKVPMVEISRTHISDINHLHHVGEEVRVLITEVHKEYPFFVNGSIRQTYLSLFESRNEYYIGETLEVTLSSRLNEDGYFAEITPNIPGILSSYSCVIDDLKPGDIVRGRICKIDIAKGIKLEFVEKL